MGLDANIFYNLETWVSNPSQPSTTLYLSHMHIFQRHLTTTAFKIAGGLDLSAPTTTNGLVSSAKPIKQNKIAPEFASKITKSFLDSLYAVLDGMVHLASDDAEVSRPGLDNVSGGNFVNRLEMLDLTNPVSRYLPPKLNRRTS